MGRKIHSFIFIVLISAFQCQGGEKNPERIICNPLNLFKDYQVTYLEPNSDFSHSYIIKPSSPFSGMHPIVLGGGNIVTGIKSGPDFYGFFDLTKFSVEFPFQSSHVQELPELDWGNKKLENGDTEILYMPLISNSYAPAGNSLFVVKLVTPGFLPNGEYGFLKRDLYKITWDENGNYAFQHFADLANLGILGILADQERGDLSADFIVLEGHSESFIIMENAARTKLIRYSLADGQATDLVLLGDYFDPRKNYYSMRYFQEKGLLQIGWRPIGSEKFRQDAASFILIDPFTGQVIEDTNAKISLPANRSFKYESGTYLYPFQVIEIGGAPYYVSQPFQLSLEGADSVYRSRVVKNAPADYFQIEYKPVFGGGETVKIGNTTAYLRECSPVQDISWEELLSTYLLRVNWVALDSNRALLSISEGISPNPERIKFADSPYGTDIGGTWLVEGLNLTKKAGVNLIE